MVTIMPRQQHGMMLGPMRGHMAPNSSPFKPTINKLSSQYLIQDHMSSHYMKLGTAKPAIDSGPPKSMMTSVKKRDQMRREAMAKQMKLFDFEKGMKHGSGSSGRHGADSSGYGSQRMLAATVTKTGHDEPRPQSVSSYSSERSTRRSYSSHDRLRPASLTPYMGTSSSRSPRDRTQTKKVDVLTETYSGDYLDRHDDRFKNSDTPFTPRLKIRAGKSFLSQSKHYAPPLTVYKETKRKVSTRKSHTEDIPPSSSTSSVHKEEKSERKTAEDKDVMEERTRSLSRLSLDSRKTYDNIYPERNLYDGYGFRSGGGNDTLFGTSSFSGRFSRNETFSCYTKNRIEAEEEEMKYLEFINSVTNDILTRGVYSDRVLTQVMERHLIQNKGRLDEAKMRHMLMKLQQDLGVSPNLSAGHYDDDHSTGYQHPTTFTDYDFRSSDLRERSHSSISRTSSRSHKPPVEESTAIRGVDDRGTPKPKKRGILKVGGGTSSGSDLERKSIASSGDEKDTLHKKPGSLSSAHADPLMATTESDISIVELSKVIDPSNTTFQRSSSIDKDLNDAISLKSTSAHSVGSVHSARTGDSRNDMEDF